MELLLRSYFSGVGVLPNTPSSRHGKCNRRLKISVTGAGPKVMAQLVGRAHRRDADRREPKGLFTFGPNVI